MRRLTIGETILKRSSIVAIVPNKPCINRGLKMRLDEKDKQIVWYLVNHPSKKAIEISKALEIPLSTVQRRIKNLEESSIIQWRLDINYEEAGLRATAIGTNYQALSFITILA